MTVRPFSSKRKHSYDYLFFHLPFQTRDKHQSGSTPSSLISKAVRKQEAYQWHNRRVAIVVVTCSLVRECRRGQRLSRILFSFVATPTLRFAFSLRSQSPSTSYTMNRLFWLLSSHTLPFLVGRQGSPKPIQVRSMHPSGFFPSP